MTFGRKEKQRKIVNRQNRKNVLVNLAKWRLETKRTKKGFVYDDWWKKMKDAD